MRILYAAVLLLFIAAVVIFCAQNLTGVSVAFLGWKLSLPIALLFLLVYLLGMFSGWMPIALRHFYGPGQVMPDDPPLTESGGAQIELGFDIV